ncbi:MAG: hypothetical protein R6U94_04005 [Nitriliruptoraceae bacterium]
MSSAAQPGADLPGWPSDAVEQWCANDARVERVPADAAFALRVLDDLAEDGEVLLYAAAKGRWAKAHTLSHDAARTSVEALLLTRGWRVTGRGGGHQATVAMVDAWLGSAPPPGPRIVRKYAAAVVARHSEEYPHPRDRARTDRELRELPPARRSATAQVAWRPELVAVAVVAAGGREVGVAPTWRHSALTR